jgi:hypothetical protein
VANQLNDPLSIEELVTKVKQLNIREKTLFYVVKCLFTN